MVATPICHWPECVGFIALYFFWATTLVFIACGNTSKGESALLINVQHVLTLAISPRLSRKQLELMVYSSCCIRGSCPLSSGAEQRMPLSVVLSNICSQYRLKWPLTITPKTHPIHHPSHTCPWRFSTPQVPIPPQASSIFLSLYIKSLSSVLRHHLSVRCAMWSDECVEVCVRPTGHQSLHWEIRAGARCLELIKKNIMLFSSPSAPRCPHISG